MRNKTKKILAGLGIGLTLTGGGLLMTGCKSDIEFNQKDLDLAISNVNEYLETQNNYSSEFARNTLNGYLMNAVLDSSRKSFEIITDSYFYNAYGDEELDYRETYKYINDGVKIKEFANRTASNSTLLGYRESVLGSDDIYDTITYRKTADNNKTFVRDKVDNLETFTLGSGGYVNYNGVLSQLFIEINSEELKMSDFIMEKKGENSIVFKCIGHNPNYIGDTSVVGTMQLEFVEGNLVSIISASLGFDNKTYTGGRFLRKNITTIKHSVSDFTFDTTGYVEKV